RTNLSSAFWGRLSVAAGAGAVASRLEELANATMIPNGSSTIANNFEVCVWNQRKQADAGIPAAYPTVLNAQNTTAVPTTMRYTANGANPRRLTQPMNHATVPYATTNDTANPIPSTTHPWASICETPMGFAAFPINDFSKSSPVAATIVGKERKNENSSAAAR